MRYSAGFGSYSRLLAGVSGLARSYDSDRCEHGSFPGGIDADDRKGGAARYGYDTQRGSLGIAKLRQLCGIKPLKSPNPYQCKSEVYIDTFYAVHPLVSAQAPPGVGFLLASSDD